MVLNKDEYQKLIHDLKALIYVMQSLDQGLKSGTSMELLKNLSSANIEDLRKIIRQIEAKEGSL
jgi:hypothetical protein